MRAKAKFPIKAEIAEKILSMNPADLTNEIARYQINIEAEKENIAKDPETIKLQDIYDSLYEEVVESDETVKQKKAELEQAKDEAITEKVIEAKQNLSACPYRDWETDRKSTRLNSSHSAKSRMPSSA